MTRIIVATLALLFLAAGPAGAQDQANIEERLAAAQKRLAAVEARAERIEEFREIKNLQRSFGYYWDEALWDAVVGLMADDATMEIGFNGVYVGRESIRDYLYSLTGGEPGLDKGALNNHFQLAPVVTMGPEGRTAKGRWHALIQTGTYGDESGGEWGDGVYENAYVKEEGTWKIQSVKLYINFYTPYDQGWTRAPEKMARNYGASDVPPDKPSTADYEPYPGDFDAPMHYANPGRSGYVFGAGNPAVEAAEKAAPPATIEHLEADVRALALEVERLKAAQTVVNTQSAYGYFVDQSMQDAIADLFVSDGTLEILGRGVFLGEDRIHEYMRHLGATGPKDGSLYNHMQLQPLVHVAPDAKTAEMRAHLFVMFGVGESAQLGESIYENNFIKDDGVWKYRNLVGYQTFYTMYENGWAKQSSPIFAPYDDMPPDMPQSVDYDPYPAVFVSPFHYDHPVTGEPVHSEPIDK